MREKYVCMFQVLYVLEFARNLKSEISFCDDN